MLLKLLFVALFIDLYIYIHSKAIVINYMPTLNQRSC